MPNVSYSVYPNQLDGYNSLPLRQNLVHEIRAEDHNRLRDAIIKIEQELGVQPSGVYATVVDRLDNIASAKALIDAHIVDATDAHGASAISVVDADDLFFYANVEKVIEELGLLLPAKPDNIGEDLDYIPNDGIPCFADGYGTKFVYNISSFAAEATDNEVKRTQTRRVSGVRGVHIIEVSSNNSNGIGWLSYDSSDTTIRWQSPGDLTAGARVDISGLSDGDTTLLRSSSTNRTLRIARNSDTLPVAAVYDIFEIYGLEAVTGVFTIPDDLMKTTDYITRTATSSAGVSRNQFMISGMVFPADHGTLVLQRKARANDEFYPIAVLDLADNFTEALRESTQPVYVPTLADFDVITLFDRISARRDYSLLTDANGNQIYENFPIDYLNTQVAHYLVPASNSVIVGGELKSPSPPDDFDEVEAEVSAYRVVHYKDGVTNFLEDPAASDIYSLSDPLLNSDDGNNTVRFSNLFVDPNQHRPGIDHINVTPPRPDTTEEQFLHLSGIKYYRYYDDVDTAVNRFGLRVESNDTIFSYTYVKDQILRFKTDVFDFIEGIEDDGYSEWGENVDVGALYYDHPVDGYTLYSDSNLPEYDRKAWYIVDRTNHVAGRLKLIQNEFSTHAFVNAVIFDPFGPGDGYDAYGDGDYVIFNRPAAGIDMGHNRDRILVNSCSGLSTATREYFTDEDYRVGESEEFAFKTDSDKFTYADGFHTDGYILEEWNNSIVIGENSLQCGGRWTNTEFNFCGLIYPQNDYSLGNIMPLQFDESIVYNGDGINVTYNIPGNQGLAANYDGYGDITKIHQRLFNLGYPISNARLRVVSNGDNPVSFSDVSGYNPDRFAKIEVLIPGGHEDNGTEWMDIGILYENAQYDTEDGYENRSDGALHGGSTGVIGNFIVPFTFGRRNNANAGNMIAVRVTYFGTGNDWSTPQNVLEDSKTRIITMLELLPPITSEL